MMAGDFGNTYAVYLLGISGSNALLRSLDELKTCIGGSNIPVRVICSENDGATLRDSLQFAETPGNLELLPLNASGIQLEWAFAHAVSHAVSSDSSDVLIMADCISPSPFFDLRMAWTAYRYPRMAAVSPLCPLDPLTSPAPYGMAEQDIVEKKDLIDSILAHTAGLKEVIEAPGFLPECVYLRHDFIRARENGLFDPDSLLLKARSQGWSQGVAPHLLVGIRDRVMRTVSWAQPVLERVGHFNGIDHFLKCAPYEETLRAFYRLQEQHAALFVQDRVRRRNLHVMHSWGGGLDHWVRLYCTADKVCENYVLKSISDPGGSTGIALALYRSIDDPTPMNCWTLPSAIRGTALHHADYHAILTQIVEECAIDTVIISSFIGHSLDLLRSPVNTIIVLHDYYPFCPALYIHFNEVCGKCDDERLKACFARNPVNNFFRKNTAEEWRTLREHFSRLLHSEDLNNDRGRVRLVAPTPSVLSSYFKLLPDLEAVPSYVIPHGDAQGGEGPHLPTAATGDLEVPERSWKLRVAVLGRMTLAKGPKTLSYLLEQLSSRIEFCIIGCGEQWADEYGSAFFVLPDYPPNQLAGILSRVAPDICLFLSRCPETFSFTLQESMSNRIPPVAPRLGAFLDRIQDEVNGILVDPYPEAFREVLDRLSNDREILQRVRLNLAAFEPKSARLMVSEYEEVIDRPVVSARTYFSGTGIDHNSHLPRSFVTPGPMTFGDFLLQAEREFLQYTNNNKSLGRLSGIIAQAIRLSFASLRGLNRARENLIKMG
jgi:glycosyltransferase involved in cell wall biosynthesis